MKGRHGGEGVDGSVDFQVYEVDYSRGRQHLRISKCWLQGMKSGKVIGTNHEGPCITI